MQKWLQHLLTVDWQPVLIGALDVVLVYFLIYRLLLLVRGTRAERMLLGLGIVGIVYILSRELNLATLNWILGNFLGSVLLVAVVLFQDDFRRALTKVGLIPGLGGDVGTAVEHSIQEISHTAGELSKRRIGALIVLEQEIGLEEYTEHAVQIDSLVGHQLLVSIFLPTSPLHDGAVVVQGDRISAAGAVLPLTFNPGISSNYGTRHRAAIGLSDRTDALIVVVSEETGEISLVREGRITRELDEKNLYNALVRLSSLRRGRGAKKKQKPTSALAGDDLNIASESQNPGSDIVEDEAADETETIEETNVG